MNGEKEKLVKEAFLEQEKPSSGGLLSPLIGKPVYVTEAFLQHPEAQRVFSARGIRTLELSQQAPSDIRWAIVHPQYGYWDNPQRVARYYDLIRTAPPDWKPPEWLDTKAIKDAYDYLKYRNKDKDWTEWKALSEDDPALPFLRNIPAPPAEVMWPKERLEAILTQEQMEQKMPFGKWEELPRWQQIYLGLLAPQSAVSGRPEWTRLTSAAFSGLLGGLGGRGIPVIIGTALTAAGLPQFGLPIIAASKVVGASVGLATAYQAYTGQKIPLLGDIFRLFDIGAIFAKRSIGTTMQFGSFDAFTEFEDAWRAAEATYAVSSIDAINIFAQILDLIDLNTEFFEVDDLAKKNQIWKISEGIIQPVTIEGPRDAEALRYLRKEVTRKRLYEYATPQEIREFVEDFMNRYGDTAIANDFIGEAIIDPANYVGFFSGKLGQIYAKATKNPRLEAAFRASTGNVLIDALPIGIQQVAEAVTGVRGSSGIFGAVELYKNMVRQGYNPAAAMDMPKDMRARFDDLIKKGIKAEEISIDGDTMRWVEDGQEKTFVASRPAEFKIPSVEELSAFEKNIAGIDERYGFKELEPVEGKGWLRRLFSLTPASQAHLLLNILHSNVATIMDMARGDVDLMARMLKQAANIDPVEAGDIGEAVLKSPAIRASAEALKYAITNNDLLDNLTSRWIASENRRVLLQKIAKALDEEPGRVIDQLKTNPDILMARINDVAPQIGKPEYLKDMLSVFVGDDAISWHPNQFQAELAVKIADATENYLRDHFHLKPDSWIFRLNRTLKGVQSLVLLGFNPGYFFNNAINNLVTRAAEGAFGFMLPHQIDEFLDRFGIIPPRLDQGIGAAGEGAIYGGKGVVERATRTNDVLDKSARVVRSISEKIGIFSRLSGDFERLESRQVTTIAIRRFMSKEWKNGKGFRRLHPAVEAALESVSPGMKKVLYEAVESGLNIGEIENAIFGEYVLPQVDAIADRIDSSMFPDNPGMGKTLLTESGMLDELRRELANVKEPWEVDSAFADVERRAQEYIERHIANDVISRAEAARAIAIAERIPAVLSMYGDLEIMIAQHWINGRRRFEDLYSKRDGMTAEQWRQEIKNEFEFQDREWRRVYELETQTYAGIIGALGINSELGRRFIDLLNKVHENWAEFHRAAATRRNEFFDNYGRKEKETYEAYIKRRDLEWNKLQDDLDDLYQKHYGIEREAQIAMDEIFAQSYADMTGWDIEAARQWRQSIRDIRFEMFNLQREHRNRVRNMSVEERNAAYADFNPVYNQMIARMKQLEHDGAYELARKTPPERVVETEPPPAPEEVPGQRMTNAEKASALMEMARKAGVVDKQGRPVARYAINVINKWLRENGKHEIKLLTDVSIEDAQAAFAAHFEHHKADRMRDFIKSKITAEDMLEMAERQRQEAEYRQIGLQNKRMILEKLRPEMLDETLRLAEAFMDLKADEYARNLGEYPNEVSRWRWYAELTENNVADIKDKTYTILNKLLTLSDPDLLANEIGKIIGFENMFGWSRYIAEGMAETPEARANYKRFTKWLAYLYKYSDINPRAKINDTPLDKILSSIEITDFDALLADKVLRIKETGRSWVLDENTIRQRAEKELVSEILSRFESEEEAIKYANENDSMSLEDGTVIDNAILYEAIKAAQDPETNPWRGEEAKTYSQEDYDQGRPVTAGDAIRLNLRHNIILPQPEEVERYLQIANEFSIEARAFAREYIEWVLDGERGMRPLAKNPLIEKHVISKLPLDEMRQTARRINEVKRIGSDPIPDTGIYVAKIYNNQQMVAAVYKDGELVALVPQDFILEKFKIRGGEATLLGVSPRNPDMLVYEVDGRIKIIDVEKPSIEDNTGLFRNPQEKRKDWYLRKKIEEMSAEEMRRTIEILRSEITVDELTGLRNLRAFLSDDPLPYVLAVDLAGLKKINDTYGHTAGDELIKSFADTIREYRAYRLHGDEFAIYANTAAEAEKIASIIRDRTRNATLITKKGDKTVEISGFDIHYGIGRNYQEADADLYQRRYGRRKAVIDDRMDVDLREQDPENPMGKVPLYGTPEPQPTGYAMNELFSEQIISMLRNMRDEFKQAMNENRRYRFGDIDPQIKNEILNWLRTTVRSDLASAKMAALRYGEQIRDAALLNYARRYGVDNILELVFPYQFWYTRTIMNWAKRMVDRPSWYAMYYRLQRAQEKMEREGMPQRLRGRMRVPMPWMPEWTGQGLWIDPLKQLFPFSQFGQPLEQFAMDKSQIERRAEQILDEMAKNELITYAEARAAKEERRGSAWQSAIKQAEAELDKSANPINMVSMLVSPALWWTIPANLLSGKPEKISPLPITRTGQTIRELGRDTAVAPITDVIGGLMAAPEEYARRKAGISEFGEWGEYYIDRMLANMAADGTISADEARIAMIQRQGAAFEEAKRRVAYETTLRTPGALGLLALKEGAKPGEILAAILTSIFPGGLFPAGELKQRGLKVEYDNAWRKLKAGDDKALRDFFDRHPEYEARLALWDDPETRLRKFLIDKVWEGYFAIDKPNRRKVVQALGQEFQDFLNRETRDEENIDIQLLASWAQTLGAALPEIEQLEGLPKPPKIDFYPPPMVKRIIAYQEERDRLFPNYYALQEEYYSLPPGPQRKAFLRRFPELREYWKWKDQYKKEYPELTPYFEDLKQNATVEQTMNDLDTAVINELLAYSLKGKMSDGGYAEMRRLYKMYGQPAGLTFEEYLDLVTRTIFR